MSKALTKAQADLAALKAELEAWIASQPAKPAKPAKRTRKPAVKRTPATVEDVRVEDVVTPAPAPASKPRYVSTAGYVLWDLPPERIAPVQPVAPVQPAAPHRPTASARRTLRQAFMDGYNGK